MIKVSEIGGLYQSTPANLKDTRTKAFMYACDRQIARLLERSKKTMVWCAIETVDEKYLDFMAADCRALFYDSSLDVDVKRKLIENNQYWYMKLGTSKAMEEMLSVLFPDSENKVMEWYEYGSKPYRFKISTNAGIDYASAKEFEKALIKVKNARSILDNIEFIREPQILFPIGVGIISSTNARIAWEE